MFLEPITLDRAIAPALNSQSVAVIIPCYRVREHIIALLGRIGPDVDAIYCIDDACPEGTGSLVETLVDPRITVLYHEVNQGVGGAVISGYRAALAAGHDILVKIDGDGQMDPALIGDFVCPIQEGSADYTKGNRFFDLESTRGMPLARLIGNSALSFVTKLSSGYWTVFDPTNGYTAIHRELAAKIVERPVDRRYFFESDMLLNLYLLRAVVRDVPMAAHYGSERSNLSIRRVAWSFFAKNVRNCWRRFLVHYLVRDFSFATLEAVLGLLLIGFGFTCGSGYWYRSFISDSSATPGQVMIAALPILTGLQLLLSALNFDIRNVPTVPRHPQLAKRAR